MMETTALSPIDKELERLTKAMDRIQRWRPLQEMALEIQEVCIDLKPRPEICASESYGIGIDLSGLSSKEPVLKILREIRKRGYVVDSISEDADAKMKCYHFKAVETKSRVPLVLWAWFRPTDTDGNPAVCTFVKTGTKKIDVFELQCNDANKHLDIEEQSLTQLEEV